MTTWFKLTFSAAVFALRVAAGGFVALAVQAPWTLAGVTALAGMLNGHLGSAAPAGREGIASAPPAAQEAQRAPATDIELHLPDVLPAAAAAPARPEPPKPVDYARLNGDVKVVTDTLERFNQKLLLMIAQARAAQQQSEAQRNPTPPPAPAPAEEAQDAEDDENEPET